MCFYFVRVCLKRAFSCVGLFLCFWKFQNKAHPIMCLGCVFKEFSNTYPTMCFL